VTSSFLVHRLNDRLKDLAPHRLIDRESGRGYSYVDESLHSVHWFCECVTTSEVALAILGIETLDLARTFTLLAASYHLSREEDHE
jgi:hypothetical protein